MSSSSGLRNLGFGDSSSFTQPFSEAWCPRYGDGAWWCPPVATSCSRGAGSRGWGELGQKSPFCDLKTRKVKNICSCSQGSGYGAEHERSDRVRLPRRELRESGLRAAGEGQLCRSSVVTEKSRPLRVFCIRSQLESCRACEVCLLVPLVFGGTTAARSASGARGHRVGWGRAGLVSSAGADFLVSGHVAELLLLCSPAEEACWKCSCAG